MAVQDIGAVIVETDDRIFGIITDRDITVRAVARGLDPASTKLGDICSTGMYAVSPEEDSDVAVVMMKERAIRRVPVVEDSRAVGILSLGDLARDRDLRSALGEISSAPPNR
jgi:CBS domain-containing protein